MTPEEQEELDRIFATPAYSPAQAAGYGSDMSTDPGEVYGQPEADMTMTEEEAAALAPDVGEDPRADEVAGINASVRDARAADWARMGQGGAPQQQRQSRLPELPKPLRPGFNEAAAFARAGREQRAGEGIQTAIRGLGTLFSRNAAVGQGLQLPGISAMQDYLGQKQLRDESATRATAAQERADTQARQTRQDERQQRLDAQNATTEGLQQQRLRQQVAVGEDEAGVTRGRNDPASPESAMAREAVRRRIATLQSGEGMYGNTPEMQSIGQIAENLDSMSAAQIERLVYPELDYAERIRTGQNPRPRVGAGGSALGAGRPTGTPMDPQAAAEAFAAGTHPDPLRQALYDGLVAQNVTSAENAARMAATMSQGMVEDDYRQMLTAGATQGRSEATAARMLSGDLADLEPMRQAAEGASGVLTASDADLQAALIEGDLPPRLAGLVSPQRRELLNGQIQRLQNQILKIRSGAAVTDQELQRLQMESGRLSTASPAVIRQWVRDVQRELAAQRDLRMRGAPERVRQQFESAPGGSDRARSTRERAMRILEQRRRQ